MWEDIPQDEIDAAAANAEPLPIQRKSTADAGDHASAAAASGFAAGSVALPHLGAIQQSFGRHDVGGVEAHVGGEAKNASEYLGARAYASGDQVAFGSQPDLHTAAHEAAHVIQQRSGTVAPGVDRGPGDAAERHADAVADAVVKGESAEALLDDSPTATPAVQRETDPNSVDARAFLDQWWAHGIIGTGYREAITDMLIKNGTFRTAPYAQYWLQSTELLDNMINAILARFPNIDALIAPESLLALVDRARGLDWDQKDDKSPPVKTNVGPMSYAYWRPVAHELTNAIARHFLPSMARTFPRFTKEFVKKNPPPAPDAKPAPTSPSWNLVMESEVLVSHPFDVLLRRALHDSQSPAFNIDFQGAAKDHPELATVNNDTGLAPVALFRESGLYHWVKASPADATREQVAAQLFGAPEQAYRLIAMPPYWGYHARDVEVMERIPRLSLWTVYKDALAANEGPPDDIGVALGVVHRDDAVEIDPVAELMGNGGAAIAKSRAKQAVNEENAKLPPGTTPKRHDEADIVALTSRNLRNLEDIEKLVPLFGKSLDPVQAAWRTQSRRNTDAAQACLVDTATPYYLAEKQAGLLTSIALGLSATAGELVNGGAEAAPEAVRVPCAEVADAYLAAITALELPEIATPRVAEADALQSNLKISIQEATLHSSLAELSSQWNSGSLTFAQRQGDPAAAQAHDDARERTDDQMRRYTEQEDKLAALRIQNRTNPAKANAEADALKPKVDDLGFEIGINEKLDRLTQIWFAIHGEEDFWENDADEAEGKKLKEDNRKIYEQFKTTVYDPFVEAQKADNPDGKRAARTAYYNLLQGQSLQDHTKKLRDFLTRVHKHKKWKRFIVALVIAFVAFGLGQWTFGALVLEAGVFGAAIAAGVVTTGVTTVLNKAILNQNPTAVGIITGFAFNAGTFFVVGKLAMAARAAAVETAAVEGTAQALSKMEGGTANAAGAADAGASTAAKVGTYARGFAVETVIAESIGLAQAEIEKLAAHGRTLTWDEIGEVAVQQLIGVVAMRVMSAATGDLFQYKSANAKLGKEIDLLAHEQAEIRTDAQALAEKSRANPLQPDKAAAEALLERWRNYLEREKVLREKILAIAAKHPERFKAGDIAKLKAAGRDPRLTQQLAEAEALLSMEQIGVNRFGVDARGFDTLLQQHKSAGSEIESISTDPRTGQRTVKLKPADGGPAIELVENLANVGERTAMKIPVSEARSFEAWLEGRERQATKPPGQDQLRELYVRDPEAAVNLAAEKYDYKRPTSANETGVLVKADAPGEAGKTPPTPAVTEAQRDIATQLGSDVTPIGNDRFMAPADRLKEIRASYRDHKPSEIIYEPESNSSHFEVEIGSVKVRVETLLEAPIQSYGALDSATNRIVGRPVNAEAGHTIMQRLARGEGSALSEVGIAGEARMPGDPKTEFGLGELANGDVVIIRGEKGAVDWSNLPGIKPKGHTHPDVPGNDLLPNAQGQRAEPLAELFEPRINEKTQREEPLLNRELILPSADDFIMMAQQAIDGHRVYSAFIIENGQVVKAPPGYQGPRLEFTMGQPREVGVLPDGRRVYRSTLEGHLGKDTPIHEEIWTVQDKVGDSGNLLMREPPSMTPIQDIPLPRSPGPIKTRTMDRDPVAPTPGTKKFVEIPADDLANLHQRTDSHVDAALDHIKDATPDVKSRLTAAGRKAAEESYRLKVGTGMKPADARKQAGNAAKKAIKDTAPGEATTLARSRADAAMADGTVFDPSKLLPDAKTQLDEFRAGRSGSSAKALAPQLTGKTMTEMQATLDFHVRQGHATKTSQRIADPTNPAATQEQLVYEFTDGTMIRLKPRGDDFGPAGPKFSIEVKKVAPSNTLAGQDGIAFKVNERGEAVPKGPYELANPYEKGRYQLQHDEFKDAVMSAGHQRAQP